MECKIVLQRQPVIHVAVLELSEAELATLITILRRVGGDPVESARGHVEAVLERIKQSCANAHVDYNELIRGYENTIEFLSSRHIAFK